MSALSLASFKDLLLSIFTDPEAFNYDVSVFEGLRQNISGKFTLQIFPTNQREVTQAENVVSVVDTWQIAGVVNTNEENVVSDVIQFLGDVKSNIDKLSFDERDFTYAILPDAQISYEGYPYVVFNLQLEVSYIRRINS